MEGSPAVNVKKAKYPLQITLPNGKIINSTHTCNLDIPWLPSKMTEAHIVPGLTHSSLISTRKFCDAGCKVVFDEDECRVYYKRKLVLSGRRDRKSGLWKLPINPTANTSSPTLDPLDLQHSIPLRRLHSANNLYTLPYKQQQLKYMHQAFFNPPIQTIIDAAMNGQLEGVPFLSKPALIQKYLAPSPATSKGRMKRPKQGTRSTRRQPSPTQTPADEPPVDCNVIPPDAPTANNIFCFAALADKQTGTLYTDATGALPVLSLEGMQYFFVAYDYDTNYIFALPIKNLKDDTIVAAFEEVFTTLTDKGHRPTFNVSDNQASAPIKKFLQKENCRWQFVEPTNHRVNAAERAIQTFKNHFISGLCSTDDNWPLQLWDQLAEQALITLNLLRTSRIDPSKSAYHQLHGHKYDWNAHPLAPPGSRAVIYLDPDGRPSWGARGADAWYSGPSLDHYRCMKFFVPETKNYRVSGSYDLFPQHCLLPDLAPADHADAVADKLVDAVQQLDKKQKRKLLNKLRDMIQRLTAGRSAHPQRVGTEAT